MSDNRPSRRYLQCMNPVPLDPAPDTHSQKAEDVENEQSEAKELSPAEQMELYEKDLKEHDWGHQPC